MKQKDFFASAPYDVLKLYEQTVKKDKKKKKKRNELIDKYLLKMAIEGFID